MRLNLYKKFNKMKKPILFIFIWLFIFNFTAYSQNNSLPDSVKAKLIFGIKGFKERYQSPSITVAIIHDQEIVFSESIGFIDLENKIPATLDAKYPIQSVSKLFTATMLMQLNEKVVVSLEDDVIKYVSEFKSGTNKPKAKTTLLQLATHTSGLPRNVSADIVFAQQADRWFVEKSFDTLNMSGKDEFLHSLQYVEYEYPKYEFLPYGDRHYSNLGYSLLGIALERAAKTDFATYIINNICKPLNMNNTGFIDEAGTGNKLARGYHYDNQKNTFDKAPVFLPNSALYAGGMYSTAIDIAKFISFQFKQNSNILSDEYKSMMIAFRIGWKPEYPFVFHEGSIIGSRTMVAINPKLKLGWVILVNTSDFDFSRINKWFSENLLAFYTQNSNADLSQYVGTYQLSDGSSSLNIYLKNGNLYSTYLSDLFPDSPLSPSGNNRFTVQGAGEHSIGDEFIFEDKPRKIILNLGQLMWTKK
jgi:CubicO group peptidase (beta-lactamase class C family)